MDHSYFPTLSPHQPPGDMSDRLYFTEELYFWNPVAAQL